MLSPQWRRRTIGCVVLSGIDFNAYQLFFSFVTLYAKSVRHASAETMGATVALKLMRRHADNCKCQAPMRNGTAHACMLAEVWSPC